MMVEKRRYFAQASPGKNHKSSCFATLDDARMWIGNNGGGVIKIHDERAIDADGNKLAEEGPESALKGWRVIETWLTVIGEMATTAVSPLQQTFLDVRDDTALSGHALGEFKPVKARRPSLFRAYCQICGRFLEVNQTGVIYSLLGGRCWGRVTEAKTISR